MSAAMTAWLERAERTRRRRDHVRTATVPERVRIDLASNDYLRLSRDPRVVDAALAATARWGAGARASRVVTGTLPVHTELEDELCALSGRASALVFSSGYTANLAAVTALSGPDAHVYLDAHAHASLHDAARLSRSRVTVLAHNDPDAVADALAHRAERRALVVVESIYSVLGDAADLTRLAEVCARYDATLVVDEAHGLGVAGNGRGAVFAAGLADRDDVVVTATLSKALGSMGGAVLASALVRRHLVNAARSFLFDTALAPSCAAAAARAATIIRTEPTRVRRLRSAAGELAAALGVPVSAGAVQSLAMPSAAAAHAAARELASRGILVGCFRPPSVPDGVSRLRFAAHSELDAASITEVATEVRRAMSPAGAA